MAAFAASETGFDAAGST